MIANASNTGFNATNTSIADGSYTVKAYCNDTLGNKNYTSEVTFSKDTVRLQFQLFTLQIQLIQSM